MSGEGGEYRQGRYGYHQEPGSRNVPATLDDLPGKRRPGVIRACSEWDPVTWGGEVDDDLEVEEDRACPTCGRLLPEDANRNKVYCGRGCWPHGVSVNGSE